MLRDGQAEVCGEYGYDTGAAFLDAVKGLYTYDRTAAADSEGKWSDIDSTTLFGKVRYSPLADYYFDMQTGSNQPLLCTDRYSKS